MTSFFNNKKPVTAYLIYDGDCPVCKSYVHYVRIQKHCTLHLIDARNGGKLIEDVVKRGYDLNQGMVLKIDNQYFFGADCIHVISLIGSSVNLFNRINVWFFKSPKRAHLLYPTLRFGRNLLLCLLRKKKITY